MMLLVHDFSSLCQGDGQNGGASQDTSYVDARSRSYHFTPGVPSLSYTHKKSFKNDYFSDKLNITLTFSPKSINLKSTLVNSTYTIQQRTQ